MFYYIIKDFQSVIKTQKLLFVLLICIQLLSTIIIFFAYGVINHYNTQIGVTEGTDLTYASDIINFEEHYTYDEVMKFQKTLLERYEHKIEDCIFIARESSNNENASHFIYSSIKNADGKYVTGSNRFYRGVLSYIVHDAYIYNEDGYIVEQFDKNVPVALVGENVCNGKDSVILYGKEFRIIGIVAAYLSYDYYIPYSQMPVDGHYIGVGFTLSKPLLETEYKEIQQIVESCFDGKAKLNPEFNGIKNENQYRVYKSIIAILVAFVVMSGVNYSIIFSHILDKRRRMLAVSRICGCTGIKSVIIYMIEIMSVSLITLAGGMLIFIYGILPKIKSTFEYIEYYLNTKVYIELALIYVGILVVIYLLLVLRFARKTPVRLIKEV